MTWLDDNGDGLQNEADGNRISGVKVSLYWLQNGQYVPYCSPNSDTPMSIETGHMVSVLTGETKEYEQGRYKFTDLPEGTFAVKFEDGSKKISSYIASPTDRGGHDDTIDSDGIATYNGDQSKLEHTWIEGIVMKPAKELTYGTEESKYHDSGFYERGCELPDTGGTGTSLYTTGGLLLMMATASFFLLYNHTKRRKEDRASS